MGQSVHYYLGIQRHDLISQTKLQKGNLTIHQIQNGRYQLCKRYLHKREIQIRPYLIQHHDLDELRQRIFEICIFFPPFALNSSVNFSVCISTRQITEGKLLIKFASNSAPFKIQSSSAYTNVKKCLHTPGWTSFPGLTAPLLVFKNQSFKSKL